MADNNIKNMIGEVFNEIADAMKTGNFGNKSKSWFNYSWK